MFVLFLIKKIIKWFTFEQHGSQLKADYDVTWAREGFFRDSRSQAEESSRNRMPVSARWHYRNEAPGQDVRISQSTYDDTRRKKFKVRDQIKLANKLKSAAIEPLQLSQSLQHKNILLS